MKDFDMNTLLQALTHLDPQLAMAGVGALIGLLAIWLVYVYWKRSSNESVDIKPKKVAPKAEAPAAPKQPAKQAAVAPEPAFVADETPQEAPVLAAAEPPPVVQAPSPAPKPVPVRAAQPAVSPAPAAKASHKIPEESVLRRHYLTHLRYMIETVNAPRPTESVLRRHYEQLIASQLDDCLKDEAKVESLNKRYDEHRKNAFQALAA